MASDIDPSSLVLIVVGAHLRAEIGDRPLANRLRDRIGKWLLEQCPPGTAPPCVPLVCCDVWYLNHEPLHRRPTISLGGPGVNALSAYLYRKLRTVFAREEHLIIQLDPEFTDLRACLWGMTHELTVDALNLFDQKYLDPFLRAVATQVEPI